MGIRRGLQICARRVRTCTDVCDLDRVDLIRGLEKGACASE